MISNRTSDCNLQKRLTCLKKLKNDRCGFGRLDALNELLTISSFWMSRTIFIFYICLSPLFIILSSFISIWMENNKETLDEQVLPSYFIRLWMPFQGVEVEMSHSVYFWSNLKMFNALFLWCTVICVETLKPQFERALVNNE